MTIFSDVFGVHEQAIKLRQERLSLIAQNIGNLDLFLVYYTVLKLFVIILIVGLKKFINYNLYLLQIVIRFGFLKMF